MPDPLIKERLELILEHIAIIKDRMAGVPDAAWFISGEEGQIMFDSLIARLQPIGENIRKIEKIEPGFTEKYLSQNPGNIIRFRDLISHHYELLDPQIIFSICKKDIPGLHQSIVKFLNSLQ